MKKQTHGNQKGRKENAGMTIPHPADRLSNTETFAQVLAEAEAVQDQVELSANARKAGDAPLGAWAPLLKPWMGWILRGEKLRRPTR